MSYYRKESDTSAFRLIEQARALRTQRLSAEPVVTIISTFNEKAVNKIALLPQKNRLHIAFDQPETVSNPDLNVVRWGLVEAGWSNVVVTQDQQGVIEPRQIHIEVSHDRLAGMAWPPRQQEPF